MTLNVSIPDKTVPLDEWQNKEFSFGMSIPDLSKNQEEIKDLYSYAINVTQDIKETAYQNENSDKLWVWNNLGLIFSTGIVFEEDDKKMLDEILNYFDSSQTCFIPCQFQMFNYNNDIVKLIEMKFGIDNGNYHYILIPFIMTDDSSILSKAPEKNFKSFGPINIIQGEDNIVQYIIDLNDKYGAVATDITPSVANYLNINQNSNLHNTNNYNDSGIVRTMNPTTNNWQQHGGNFKRIQRKGYIDAETSDWQELVDPQQDYNKIAPNKYWGEEDSESSYRRNMKAYHRENAGVNMGWFNKEGYNQNVNSYRSKVKNSLYNQLHSEQLKNVEINQTKGVHMKMNDYYETEENKINKPNYTIYETSDSDNKNIFIDSIEERDKMPSGWGNKSSFNIQLPKSSIQTEIENIIGTTQKIKILNSNL